MTQPTDDKVPYKYVVLGSMRRFFLHFLDPLPSISLAHKLAK